MGKKDLGIFKERYNITLVPHDSQMLKVTPVKFISSSSSSSSHSSSSHSPSSSSDKDKENYLFIIILVIAFVILILLLIIIYCIKKEIMNLRLIF